MTVVTKEEVFRRFEEMKPASLWQYENVAMALLWCNRDEAELCVFHRQGATNLKLPKERLSEAQIEKVLEIQGFTPKREYNA